MTKPIVPIDPKGLDEVAESLLVSTPKEDEDTHRAPARIENPESYIILPGKQDTLISMDRVHLGKNWNQCHEALAAEDSFMPTIRSYVDFLQLLKSGKPIYNGKGNKVDAAKVNALLDDILTKRDPYRGEWLDAKFDKSGLVRSNWSITYHKIKNDGTLEEVTEPLQECLREDKNPGIDLNYWLSNATQQGLPPKNNSTGSLYYWHPRDSTVARFGAGSDGVGLDCIWGPRDSGPGLGVRRQKFFHRK